MPSEIIKQPDGRYAIFSTIVDNYTFLNLSREEVLRLSAKQHGRSYRAYREQILDQLDRGEKPHPLAHTWEEALEVIENRHGPQAVETVQAELQTLGDNQRATYQKSRKELTMFIRIFHCKGIGEEAKTLSELIDALKETTAELEDMQREGVILEDDGGQEEDYFTLATDKEETARRYQFQKETNQ